MILQKGDVKVQKGYLFTKDGDTLIANDKLVKAYREAHYLTSMATAAKEVSFSIKETIQRDEWLRSFRNSYNSKKIKKKKKKEVSKPLTENLAKEAKNFLEVIRENEIIDEVNDYLLSFDIIFTFEEVGVLFKEGPQSFEKDWLVSFKDLKKAVMFLMEQRLL